MSVKDVQLLRKRLWVTFSGERGLDYGGLARCMLLQCPYMIFSLGSGFIYSLTKCLILTMVSLNIQPGNFIKYHVLEPFFPH